MQPEKGQLKTRGEDLVEGWRREKGEGWAIQFAISVNIVIARYMNKIIPTAGGRKKDGRNMDIGCQILEVGSRESDIGCWHVSDIGGRMSDVGYRMSDVGSWYASVNRPTPLCCSSTTRQHPT